MRLVCAAPLAMLLLLLCAVEIRGHGRLRVPPSRASMWRDGFNTPINYNDNELSCGGAWYQNGLNGGKCGVCGDPWGKPDPQFEAGGKYANGIITRTYTEGQEIGIAVEVTVQHGGWFEFRICPNNDFRVPVTHGCLDRNLLSLADGSGYRMYMGVSDPTGFYNTTLRLPTGLSCTQCVLQWKWHTGNSWGTDEEGRSCVGCGPQEEFYGCADVAIVPFSAMDNPQDAAPARTPPPAERTTQASADKPTTSQPPKEEKVTTQPPRRIPDIVTTARTEPQVPEVVTAARTDPQVPGVVTAARTEPQVPEVVTAARTDPQVPGVVTAAHTQPRVPEIVTAARTEPQVPEVVTAVHTQPRVPEIVTAAPTEPRVPTPAAEDCVAADGYEGNARMDRWCQVNCPLGNCPASLCRCGPRAARRKVCKTTNVGPWKTANLDTWCARNCAAGFCPATHCICEMVTVAVGVNNPE